ncbi:hypothetical protein SKAU_G00364690 [Synaphobranchus kaupii]|uniref:Uncharacterized protein n=1 Tax=Synaphobranchus kaupii TaxID=118154 RepID=A0A9Q1EEV3_SYNKA|nr:hypothetical protein SKAU_G00364690 [Synaphobranchus kaupii]
MPLSPMSPSQPAAPGLTSSTRPHRALSLALARPLSLPQCSSELPVQVLNGRKVALTRAWLGKVEFSGPRDLPWICPAVGCGDKRLRAAKIPADPSDVPAKGDRDGKNKRSGSQGRRGTSLPIPNASA